MRARHLAGEGPMAKDKERYKGGAHSTEGAQGRGTYHRPESSEKTGFMWANLRDMDASATSSCLAQQRSALYWLCDPGFSLPHFHH